MSPDAQSILEYLGQAHAVRAGLDAEAALAARVRAVKHYQNRRFERTYADQMAAPDTAAAARFFLTDLYGTQDYTERDTQFGRIVRPLDKLFPAEVVRTVRDLAELHALSETLDRRMGEALATDRPDARAYVAAWCAVGEPASRERQIALMSVVGGALVHYTRNPWLRRSLHLMRGPARLAGLAALHGFLERGYDTFAAMRAPQAFLDTIAARERVLAAELYARPEPPPAVLTEAA